MDIKAAESLAAKIGKVRMECPQITLDQFELLLQLGINEPIEKVELAKTCNCTVSAVARFIDLMNQIMCFRGIKGVTSEASDELSWIKVEEGYRTQTLSLTRHGKFIMEEILAS